MDINVKIEECYKWSRKASGWCEGLGHRIESRGWISCHLLAIVARLQGEGSASQQCATREPS